MDFQVMSPAEKVAQGNPGIIKPGEQWRWWKGNSQAICINCSHRCSI